MRRIILLSCVLLLFCSFKTEAAIYEFDPVYSNILFKIKHLSGFNVGLFNRFGGVIEIDDQSGSPTLIDSTVDVRSIYTRHGRRDRDLQGADIFDTKKFPQARFSSKKFENGKLIGDLTIKGKTKPVTFDYTLGEVTKDQWGRTKIALSANGVINRKDFDITYNRTLDKGQLLLGDQVELQIEIEGVLRENNSAQ